MCASLTLHLQTAHALSGLTVMSIDRFTFAIEHVFVCVCVLGARVLFVEGIMLGVSPLQ